MAASFPNRSIGKTAKHLPGLSVESRPETRDGFPFQPFNPTGTVTTGTEEFRTTFLGNTAKGEFAYFKERELQETEKKRKRTLRFHTEMKKRAKQDCDGIAQGEIVLKHFRETGHPILSSGK